MITLMMIIGFIGISLFIYATISTSTKPKTRNLNDMINDSQKSDGLYSNVYLDYELSKMTHINTYYIDSKKREPGDKKVFEGTVNECENYIYVKNFN